MYFADLSPYEYLEEEPATLDVGWLVAEHDFTRGEVADGFIERLRSLENNPVNPTRGFHIFRFCKNESVRVSKTEKATVATQLECIDQMIKSGAASSAEIRVHRKDGRFYAAPVLIRHYVEVNKYQPPQEFVEAVMADDQVNVARPKQSESDRLAGPGHCW